MNDDDDDDDEVFMKKSVQTIIMCILALLFPLFVLVIWDIVLIIVYNLTGYQLGSLSDNLPGSDILTQTISGNSMSMAEIARSIISCLIVSIIRAYTPIKNWPFKEPNVIKFGLLDVLINITLAALVMSLLRIFTWIFDTELISFIISMVGLAGVLVLGALFILKKLFNPIFIFQLLLAFAKLLLSIFALTVGVNYGIIGSVITLFCIIACGVIVMVECREKGYVE